MSYTPVRQKRVTLGLHDKDHTFSCHSFVPRCPRGATSNQVHLRIRRRYEFCKATLSAYSHRSPRLLELHVTPRVNIICPLSPHLHSICHCSCAVYVFVQPRLWAAPSCPSDSLKERDELRRVEEAMTHQ